MPQAYHYQSGKDHITIDTTDKANDDILLTVSEDEESAYPLPSQVARIFISRDEVVNLIAVLAKSLRD